MGLENLKLGKILVSLKFCEWISSCKSLKKLYLESVDVTDGLNISSSSLEDLILEDVTTFLNIKISAERLKNLHITWVNCVFTKGSIQSLTLHAPKLEWFFWDGYASNYSYEGNLESLCSADISLIPNLNNQHGALDNGIICKVLQSMYRVSSMCIHVYSIQEISSREVLPEFCNLHSLTPIRTGSSEKIPSTVCLLNSMPHLNTLKIQGVYSKGEMICYNTEYWESQNLKFVHSLKELEMEISGEQNEIEMIKYLLKNAKALKTMTIHYLHYLGHRQLEISRKIQQFQIASSSIAIYFFHKNV